MHGETAETKRLLNICFRHEHRLRRFQAWMKNNCQHGPLFWGLAVICPAILVSWAYVGLLGGYGGPKRGPEKARNFEPMPISPKKLGAMVDPKGAQKKQEILNQCP